MNPAERRRFALAVTGAMLIVFCLALSLMFLDSKIFEPGDTQTSSARRAVIIGTTKVFSVYDYSLEKRVKVNMICASIGDHSIIYQEPSINPSRTLLNRITSEFDEDIYPAYKNQFLGKAIMETGKEDKIIMLLLNNKRGRPADLKQRVVAGYYSQDNEKLKAYKSESNEARIIHIFIGKYSTSSDAVLGTVAHEARHLKNWSITKNNVGLIIGSLFAAATVLTLYFVLSNLYLRSFAG